MKRLLLIPLMSLPLWLYSCTHHTPPTPTPAEVIKEAHEALPAAPQPDNPCTKYPCILPKETPKPKVKHAPRQARHPAPPMAPMAYPQTVPVDPPPVRCLFWFIGEAGCLPTDAYFQTLGY